MKKNLLVILAFCSCIIFNSCSESGCTDPTALNYNSSADDDDGSCIKCTLSLDSSNSVSGSVVDHSVSSPHYSENVATLYFKQVRGTYSSTDCGSNSCYFLIYAQNNISDSMTFNYHIQLAGNIQLSESKSITIPPNQFIKASEILETSITNPCGLLSAASMSITTGSIIYH